MESEEKETLAAAIIAWLLIGIMIGVPILVASFGYRDILLFFQPKSGRTTGEIISSEQRKSPFLFPKRGGDWRIDYQFELEGKTYRGNDVMPPAIMDTDATKLTIRYFPPNPEISRIDSQVSRTPIYGLAIFIGLLFFYFRERIRSGRKIDE